jgi:RecA-family ATPase
MDAEIPPLISIDDFERETERELRGPTPRLELFDVGDEDGNISPREWLLGTTYCRGNLSGLISAGAGGKTTVRILQALSLAAGRELTGEHVFVRSRVMIICLADDMTELRRRVRAAMLHHGVKPAGVKGFLILTTPRGLKIAERDASGKIVAGGLHRALLDAIGELKLDLVCIDPAIKAHALSENDNGEIDAFASLLTRLATEKNIAIDLLSHERKAIGAEAGDVNRGRGAGSQKDAARLVYTLTGMSKTEAATLGVSDVERKSLVRIDSAKVNIAPPTATTTWLRIVGVNLENGNKTYPNGDNVQTVERWTPAPLFDGLSSADLNCVLRKLSRHGGRSTLFAGLSREESRRLARCA